MIYFTRENCEEWRQRQTQELLVQTKQAQLHQIEENKKRYAREQIIEQNWLAAMTKLHQEKAYQQDYADKLRKVIEGWNQQKNLALQEEKQKQERLQQDALREFYQEELVFFPK